MSDVLNEVEAIEAGKQELEKLMTHLCDDLLRSSFLDKIEKGELPREQWPAFAVQRYLAANNFEALLEAGLSKATAANDQGLANTLQQNLDDETGIKGGEVDSAMAHSTWRKDFYKAIGVDETQLTETEPAEGAKAYGKEIEKLCKEELLKIAGAILFLEFSLPEEFKKMQAGRDAAFPELDTRARLYLDDHIIHDAKWHYPGLLNALQPHLADPEKFSQIEEGIRRIAEVKKNFYSSLEAN